MNRRAPYVASSLGHLVLLGVLFSISALQQTPAFVPGIRIVALADKSPRERSADTASKSAAVVAPTPKVEPPPPPEVEKVKPKAAEKSPPARPAAKAPDRDGTLAPERPEIVSKSRSAPKPTTAAPAAATAPTAPAVDAVAASHASSGIEMQAEGEAGPIAGYLSVVREKVGANWQAPVAVGRHGEVRVVVVFVIDREGGAPQNVTVQESSGNSQFDRAAMSAVLNSRPLPPLPPGWATDTIGIQFTFHQEY